MRDVLVLATVKEMLEISHTAQDTILQIMMDAAESEVEDFLGYDLTSASHTETIDGGGYTLYPTHRPVTAITSVTDVQTGEVIAAGDRVLVDDGIELDSGVRWAAGPSGRWQIIYTGGWTDSTRPKKIESVLYDIVYRFYHNRGAKLAQASGGYSVSWDGSDSDLARRLRRYRAAKGIIG